MGKHTETIRKVLGLPLQKSIDKQPDGTLIVRGYFTSDNKDEVGDIITRDATERALTKYRQWGNIRRMHQPDPVGKVLRIGVVDGLEWNEVEIHVIEPRTVFDVEHGLLTALSVGIFFSWDDVEVLEDGGWKINDYTLAEISLVDHPANYDARLQRALASGEEARMLVRQYGFDALERIEKGDVAMPEEEVIEQLTNEPESEPVIEAELMVDAAAEPTVVEEETAVLGAAEDAAAPAVEPDEQVAEIIRNAMESIQAQISSLLDQRLQVILERLAEVQASLVVNDGDDGEDNVGVPVNRAGLLPEETVVPDEKSIEKEPEHPTLRAALEKMFLSR